MLLLLFQGRRIKKLEELYGIQNGGNHGNQHTGGRSNNVGCGSGKPHTREELYGVQNGGDRKSVEIKTAIGGYAPHCSFRYGILSREVG